MIRLGFMEDVKIEQILEELDLDIDDIKWYLAFEQAKSLLNYSGEPEELAKHIWKGRLEADLYRMEERFLEDLQSQLNSGEMNREEIINKLREVEAANNKRWSS
jgi:hypothetical protein